MAAALECVVEAISCSKSEPSPPFLVTRLSCTESRVRGSYEDIDLSDAVYATEEELRAGMGRFYSEFASDWGTLLTASEEVFQTMVTTKYPEASNLDSPSLLPIPNTYYAMEWCAIFRAIINPSKSSHFPLDRCLELLASFQSQLEGRIGRWVTVTEYKSTTWRWINNGHHDGINFNASK